VLAGQQAVSPNHRIQGGGYSRRELPLLSRGNIDGCLQVSDNDCIEAARKLAETEGIFAGFSSGANLAAAMQLLENEQIRTVATIINDSGLKYLSTDLWS
jgi:cysteine synthase A